MGPERGFFILCHRLLRLSDGQSYSSFAPNNTYDPRLVIGSEELKELKI